MSDGEMRMKLQQIMDAEIKRIMLGGWPAGYEPGRGMPGTLTLEDIKPRRCFKVIDLDMTVA